MVEWPLLGYVPRYVVDNASCDVIVVKGDYDKDFVHDGTAAEPTHDEEAERQRVIENRKEVSTEQEQKKTISLQNRAISCHTEEEQERRIRGLDERYRIEQRQREEDLQKIRVEKEERGQGIGDARDVHLPFPKIHFLNTST
jgi:hypothetical protein